MKAPADLLVLHCSTFPGFVALSQGGQLAVQPLDGSGRERRPLLDAVQQGMRRLEVTLERLQGIVVSLGPGSFTGIRVGIATAQGLAAARAWPIWTCDSLLLHGVPWCGTAGPLAVCHDARRGEVYAALYDVSGAAPQVLVPPFCAFPGSARERLLQGAESGEGLRLTGSGATLLDEKGIWSRSVEASPERLAAAVLRLASAGGLPRVEVLDLEPFYLRRPDVRPPRAAAE